MNETNKTLQDVLLQLVDYVNRNIHVASCGIVKKIEGNTYTVDIFPVLAEEKVISISCYSLKGVEAKLGDAVLVLFTDRVNKSNINELRNNVSAASLSKLDVNGALHSYKNGIIVGIVV